MTYMGRWCRECGKYVPLNKFTQVGKTTQQRCDNCLEVNG